MAISEPQEEWRNVVGYEGYYQISSLGAVRSLDRKITRPNGVSVTLYSLELKQGFHQNGYKIVGLNKDCKQKMCRVHRLVAEAFIPNPEGKPQVNHLDGDKTNNAVENLAWCTESENVTHAFETGLNSRGSMHYGTRLNEDKVLEICNIIDATNVSFTVIAEKYDVSRETISMINLGVSWNWLTNRSEIKTTTKRILKNSREYKPKRVINCRDEVFMSTKEAAKAYEMHLSGINRACTGIRETAGTYPDGVKIKWRYENE